MQMPATIQSRCRCSQCIDAHYIKPLINDETLVTVPMISSDQYTCPRCAIPLKENKMAHGIFWGCGNCGGRAVTVELLRRTFTPESINPLWLHAMRGEGQSSV